MSGILAIETATDACSVAVYRDGQYREAHEVTPRMHSQRLFGMLRELLPNGCLRSHGIDAIAYGCGPGSFTGLRIAASAVQGLAYSNDLPAIPVSTLACQAQTALRTGQVDARARVLSVIDARINEIYGALYRFENELAIALADPVVCAPGELTVPGETEVQGVGGGCRFADNFPQDVQRRLRSVSPDLLPRARDLVPLALEQLRAGVTQAAAQVQPVYVRDEISWKKLSEQGKRS